MASAMEKDLIFLEGKSKEGKKLIGRYGGVWIIIEEAKESPLNNGERASHIIAYEETRQITFTDARKTAQHSKTWRLFKWQNDKDLKFICDLGKLQPRLHSK